MNNRQYAPWRKGILTMTAGGSRALGSETALGSTGLGSISVRMIVAITLVAAGSCAALAAFGVWQQEATVQVALERELRADYANLMAALNDETRTTLVVSHVLASMQSVKDAIRAKDRPATI